MTSSSDDTLKRFREFGELGLSQVQAHVYVVLLSIGPAPARTVSRLCSLRREDTYRALRSLKSIGLVEVNVGKPYTFVAVEPNVAMKVLMERLDSKFSSLKQNASKLQDWLQGLDRVKDTSEEVASNIIFRFESGTPIFERMSRMVANCKHELIRITSSKGIVQNYGLGVFEQERQIAKNGIRIRAITEAKASNLDILKEYSTFAQVRHLTGIDSRLKFVISDDLQMILFTTNPADSIRNLGAIWTNSKPLIEGFKKDFEVCWNGAMGLDDAVQSVQTRM